MSPDDLAPPGSYRVERHPFGIAVIGPVPIQEAVALMGPWKKAGYKLVDSHIAAKLGASLVVTTKEGSTAWRRQLGIE